MKRNIAIAATAASLLLSATTMSVSQQVVGSTLLGVTRTELRDVTTGWSAKRQVLGKTVYNDKGKDRKSTRLNSSHRSLSRMPSSA